jgi:TolB-like protein
MNFERLRADSALRPLSCENRAMQPTPDDVRAELERVLASGSFASTSRLSRFLRFVVERSLAGEAERLKEYVIGVEVFDRDEQYDPRIDSIVRVEAGRLRAKLDEYYRGAGESDPVAIVIEKGSYAPVFLRRAEASGVAADVPSATTAAMVRSTTPATDGEPLTPSRRAATSATPSAEAGAARERDRRSPISRHRFAIAAIAAIAAVIVAALVVGAAPWRGARDAEPPRTAVAVLPFSAYSADVDTRTLATRLTDGVTAELVRLDRFAVVASATARQFADTRAPMHDVARELHADLLLQGHVDVDNGQLKVVVVVVNGALDRKVWVDTLRADPASMDDLARRIAASAAAPLAAAR